MSGWRTGLLLAVLLWGTPPVSAQVDEEERGPNGWVPAFGVSGGILVDRAQGRIDSAGLRPESSDTTSLLAQLASASLELATPAAPLPGRPRLFANVALRVVFAPDNIVTGEGNPARFDIPHPPVLNEGQVRSVPAGVIEGQGSEIEAELAPLAFTAALGLSFELEWWGRTVHLKPSLQYLREEIEVRGRVHQAEGERLVTGGPPPPNDPTGDIIDDSGLDLILLAGQEQEAFHGLGPGVELELDIARLDAFVLTLFGDFAATRVISDRDVRFRSTDAMGRTADFRFEKEPWSYRAGLGLRLHWRPE